eukprot:TRINITY_DN3488_c0_g1_i14.p1 TRINITY_DN3488_c0_g1~~TRINITY_DN3488_c0_g1_i14.p1  ORF type:complete len:258 (-),score=28.54 TRINITY_DN3488_c0_g1_i14:300-1073(-)
MRCRTEGRGGKSSGINAEYGENGVVVGWGMSANDWESIRSVSQIWSGTYNENPTKEKMSFCFGTSSKVDTERDVLIVSKSHQYTEMAIYSIGLARSVKLDELELEVEQVVSEVYHVQFGHPTTGFFTGLAAQKCRDKLALIYHLSYKMTSSGLLDDPGFLWDLPESQSILFQTHSNYLDMKSRLENAGERLKLPLSYWELENSHFQHLHSWRLEIIIIIGIAVEILISLFENRFCHIFFLHSLKPSSLSLCFPPLYL